jgi:tRNA-modifying protein YgfZ
MNDQYAIIDSAAGWTERRARGRLRLEGRETVPFLQALVSNDLGALVEGRGVYATYLTPQGRMIADLRIFHRGDFLLIDVAPGVAGTLAAKLDHSVFAEDVRIADVSDALDQIGIIGHGVETIIADVLGVDPALVTDAPMLSTISEGDLIAARTDDATVPSFDVFFPPEARDRVLTRIGEAGARPMATELVEALRIEAGRPLFGVDMTEETIPLEAGLLERAISTSKGCYVGQEVIIRVLHRGGGRVAKRLAMLKIDGSAHDVPAPGTALEVDGHAVGKITSAAPESHHRGVVALGYVHRDHANIGAHVTVRAESGDRAAEITGLAG